MTPSTEIRDAALALYDRRSEGDESAVARLYSRESGVLSIGTDPNEWWEGHDAIAQVVKAQLQEMGGIRMTAGNLEAFVEGSVGWVVDCPTVRLPDGQEITFRMSAIFHKEDGEWKIVQRHISKGVPNVEAIGKELTTGAE